MSNLALGLTKSVIKHYETTPGKDEMQQEQRREVKEKVSISARQVVRADIPSYRRLWRNYKPRVQNFKPRSNPRLQQLKVACSKRTIQSTMST
jgi:hypothetical protein